MNDRLAEAPERQDRVRTAMVRRWCIAVGAAAILSASVSQAVARAEARQVTPELAAQEKEGCIQNLKAIYAAIEAYRKDHKDVPNWFSDLVPDYLPDVNALTCPVCRRTGQTDIAQLSDPRIASSYLYEFCPLPLGNTAPANPKATRREWKRRQMGVVGSIVPLVRCRHHQPILNLAFDGHVYESPLSWEGMLTNMVDPESLTPARMFPAGGAVATVPEPQKTFPARDSKTSAKMLDLTSFYNAKLTETWHGTGNSTGNDLAALPAGLQKLDGVEYDVRGIIQLGSKAVNANRFPGNVAGIKVNQKCRKLHFLHSGAFGHPTDEGKQIGSYVLHFAAAQMRMEIPIVYGKDVRDWHYWSEEQEGPPTLKVAWKGENLTSKTAGSYVRLFETTWTNLVPEVELESIDFVSSMSQPAPFLIAITLE